MAWAKREAVTNLVVLGDDEGHKKKVGGLLIGVPRDRMYPDKLNYELVQQDGEVIVLSGSASIARQLNDDDIGKFVKCEFTGWGRSANGKFKVIDVNVWEGEPTPVMAAWPRYGEFKTFTQAQKKQQAKHEGPPPKAVKPEDDGFGEDFDEVTKNIGADQGDDLPF